MKDTALGSLHAPKSFSTVSVAVYDPGVVQGTATLAAVELTAPVHVYATMDRPWPVDPAALTVTDCPTFCVPTFAEGTALGRA